MTQESVKKRLSRQRRQAASVLRDAGYRVWLIENGDFDIIALLGNETRAIKIAYEQKDPVDKTMKTIRLPVGYRPEVWKRRDDGRSFDMTAL